MRARVEHVFAGQKARMGLFIRTIGIKRAEAAIMLANTRLRGHRHGLQHEAMVLA